MFSVCMAWLRKRDLYKSKHVLLVDNDFSSTTAYGDEKIPRWDFS